MKEELKRLPIPPFKTSIKIKAKNWLKRFLPAELTGTIAAVFVSYITHYCTNNLIVAAYAGSVAETLRFYSTIFIRDAVNEKGKLKAVNKRLTFIDFIHISKNILFDFGVAEILDSLFLRPFCMYIFPLWLKNYTIGILMGKVASDICFYIPVILSYELRIFALKRRQ
jgi:hypothetical protein